MAHTAAALSDTTSVTSPTPFSPFSSAYSVSSEATVVSEGQADLGAFQSVFFALTQLQLHHQHHPRSPRNNTTTNTPIRNDDSSDDDNDDDNDDQDANHTRSNTPSLYPVSPLNLDGTVSRSSVHPSNPPSRSQLTHASEGTSGSTDEAVASDIVLAAAAGASSEAAEEGDEESIAMTSPNSHPSSDSGSIPDDYAGATFPDDEGRTWMYAESPYDPSFRPSASSEDSDGAPRQEDGPSQGGDEGTSPSLGDMEAAFAFFAAERAKLVKQLEASKSGTPITLAPALPITNRKNNKRGGGKGHRKNKSSDTGENALLRALRSQPNLPDSDEASLDASPSAVVLAIPITISSSSPDDHTFGTRKNQRRGVLPRPPKQNPKSPPRSNNSGSPNKASLATSILNSAASSSQSNIVPNNKRNRYANHRHTRSLPIDPQTVASIHQQLQPTLPTLSAAEADKIRQLARRLSFMFPYDTPSLRRVMQNPQGVLGLGSHATPSSDDALIAEGFFDPGVDGNVAAAGSGPGSALLYVFIDHSNILVGFLAWLKKQGITNAQLNGKPKLSHSALALLIERGRRCLRKVLVASSPLYQSLDEMAGMGYQISVLQRVEIKEGSSRPSRNGSGHSRSSSFNSTPNRKNGKGKGNPNGSPNKNNNNNNNNGNNNNNNNNAGSSPESDSNSQQKRNPPLAQPSFAARLVNARRTGQHHRRNLSTEAAFITPSNSNTSLGQIVEGSGTSGQSTPSTRPRFREEAVDELLQLKLLQTLLDTPSPPPPGSTIVLASGDAAKSQFNPEGFLGCVRKAVERGWNVEVVGWDEGRSRAYGELANEVIERGLGGMLTIISLDRWGKDLLENLVN